MLSFFVSINNSVELVSVSTGNEIKFIVLTDRDKININKKIFHSF